MHFISLSKKNYTHFSKIANPIKLYQNSIFTFNIILLIKDVHETNIIGRNFKFRPITFDVFYANTRYKKLIKDLDLMFRSLFLPLRTGSVYSAMSFISCSPSAHLSR